MIGSNRFAQLGVQTGVGIRRASVVCLEDVVDNVAVACDAFGNVGVHQKFFRICTLRRECRDADDRANGDIRLLKSDRVFETLLNLCRSQER